MPSRRDLLFLAFGLAAFAVLVALGLWQLERREWKETLLAQMSERATADPEPLASVEERLNRGEDIAFTRATVKGRFLHDRELFVFATADRVIGWKLVTPFETETGRHVLVDRGFIPSELRDPATRPDSRSSETVTVTGSVRLHRPRPGPFVPDNDPVANVWHWWDLQAMAQTAGLSEIPPFVLEAEPQAEPRPDGAPWPRPLRSDPAAIPNRHLEYALTWFGLAAVLLVMMGVYLFRRRDGAA